MLLTLPVVAGVVAWFLLRPPEAGAQIDARSIYLRDCATCHAADGSGSARGPSILQSGRAGVGFYLSTGRMPLAEPTQAVERHTPHYDAATINALVDYVATLPTFSGPDTPLLPPNPDAAQGGVLYRLNCAACHAWSGRGGALLHRESPPLREATDTQIAQAIVVGPGNMPSFSFDPQMLSNVARYTRDISAHPDDRGGLALWHLGPLPEGAIAVFVGLVLLLLFARAIGTRA
jgi:ubiquinol-cytochrome c reductase cytochrome c subunit